MSRTVDEEGRLPLPESIREEYGERYHLVTYSNRVALVPVAENPLATVRESTGELCEASTDRIRDEIEAVARMQSDSEE